MKQTLEKKVYSPWAYTENEEDKCKINYELYEELKDIRDKTSIGIEVVVFDERDEDARDEDERNATVYAVTLGSAERLVEAGFGNADVIGMLRDFDVDIRDEDIERHDDERYAIAVNAGDERFEVGRF